MSKYCNDWKYDGVRPKVLLIGHDPRLKDSDTIAEYSLFANYYFDSHLIDKGWKKKRDLATNSFNQVVDLTGKMFKAEEIYVTNLCNTELPHAPENYTVYIPEDKAIDGLNRIKNILLEYKSIEYIFPMSQQVNYWLQKLGFYSTDTDFILNSKPKPCGVNNDPQYYIASKDKAFTEVCGNVYIATSGQKVIPILHTKQYGKLHPTYKECYEKIIAYFKSFGDMSTHNGR